MANFKDHLAAAPAGSYADTVRRRIALQDEFAAAYEADMNSLPTEHECEGGREDCSCFEPYDRTDYTETTVTVITGGLADRIRARIEADPGDEITLTEVHEEYALSEVTFEAEYEFTLRSSSGFEKVFTRQDEGHNAISYLCFWLEEEPGS